MRVTIDELSRRSGRLAKKKKSCAQPGIYAAQFVDLLIYTAREKSAVYHEYLSGDERCRVRSEKYGRSD